MGSFRGLNKQSTNPNCEIALVILPIDTKTSLPQIVSDEVFTEAIAPTSASTPSGLQKKNSLNKKINRSSTKRKKSATGSSSGGGGNSAKIGEEDEDPVVLNNGRVQESANLQPASAAVLQRKNENITASRIQNDTSIDCTLSSGGMNGASNGSHNHHNHHHHQHLHQQQQLQQHHRISPQSSFRASLASNRRASAMITAANNAQIQHALLAKFNRQNSMKNHPNLNYRRRMSSIEQAFEKTSNINMCNLENMKSNEFVNSKLSLQSLQKSLSNINESDRLSGGASSPTSVGSTYTVGGATGQSADAGNGKMMHPMWLLLQRPQQFTAERDSYSLYIFSECNR